MVDTINTAGQYVLNTLSDVIAQKPVWAKRLYDVISSELPQLPVRSRLIMVAHAAYESGWGARPSTELTNNLYNVTAGSWWLGKNFPTYRQVNGDLSYAKADCDRQGRPMTVQPNGKLACKVDQIWRKYATVNDCIKDYWDFLGPNQNGGRYASARAALEAGDIATFGQRLYAAGYFTLPPDEYIKTLTSVVNTVSNFVGA